MLGREEIARLALSHIAQDHNLQSLDEQTTPARQCKLWMKPARIMALEQFDWSFARKRLTLTEHDEDPSVEWAYRYQYPVDCVRARLIDNGTGMKTEDPIPFTIEMEGAEKTILTDAESAALIYTFDQTNGAMYTMSFSIAMSHALAYLIAYPLTRKTEVQMAQYKAFFSAIATAAAHNANEERAWPRREAAWIRGRS